MQNTEPCAGTEPSQTHGVFVTFEGVDGAGKTTQTSLLCNALVAAGHEVIRLREPGGTQVGEHVRALLLDPDNYDMDPTCELLLYEAARAQLAHEVIRPALERGCIVVSDRFFDSTVAYQGFGRGLDPDLIDRANEIACGDTRPTRTILLDIEPMRALERAVRQGADRLEREGIEFQQRVRSGFLHVAEEDPDRVRIVNADGDVTEVWNRVQTTLADLFDLSGYSPIDDAHFRFDEAYRGS